MNLVQILLPVTDNAGRPFPSSLFDATRRELTERFGGLTAYTRAPATGLWKDDEGRVARDDVTVYEVMVERLDRAWWDAYREALRARYEQDAIVVRAYSIELL